MMNTKRLSLVSLGFVFLIAVFSSGVRPIYAETFSCPAFLDGSQEVPPVATGNAGSASVTFDSESNEANWDIRFSGLSGPATAAHFHGPAPAGVNAGVLVNIGEVSGLSSPMLGTVVLTPEQATSLLNGQMYINIHTASNPDGELRGQVRCVQSQSPPTDGQTSDVWETAELIIGEDSFDVQYMITGGTLEELAGNQQASTITAAVAADESGELTIQLPREIADSIVNDEDSDYIVFVDGAESDSASDDFGEDIRTLTIPFAAQSEQIEIRGTFVVPEFGAITAIVLAVAIVGIIVATARYSKSSFLPKM